MKKQILFTLSLVLLGMTIALVVLSYQMQQKQLQNYVDRKLTLLGRYYDGLAEHETYEMGSTLKAIMQNSDIKEAFKKGDRELLLELSGPLYKQLQPRDVTHFYFTGPNRTNILRVHNPERFGDSINRQTTLQAGITGKESSGMELGPFGTFTLRVVTPWFDGEDLIGYLELGKDVEHAVGELRKFLDIKAYAFIHKKHIVRGGWEEGLELLGRKAEWARFLASVNIGEPIGDLPPMLVKFLSDEQLARDAVSIDVRVGARTYRTGYLPLLDVNNKEIGHISVMVDMTDAVSAFYGYILMVVVICIFAVVIILIASSFILSRLEKELKGVS
ncbi:MAG: hypothetical protein IMF07_04630 [Proteobacteria bacterium]|nr:hypothetical protein [Pseudomonadota bacterium]